MHYIQLTKQQKFIVLETLIKILIILKNTNRNTNILITYFSKMLRPLPSSPSKAISSNATKYKSITAMLLDT